MKYVFVIFLMLFGAQAAAEGVALSQQKAFTASTTSSKALDAQKYRKYLLIQNQGSVDIYVKFRGASTSSEGIIISAGGNYEPERPPKEAVYIESASGTPTVWIVEGK